MKPNISTQKDLRAEFWTQHPRLKRLGRAKQNEYPAEVRFAWCSFVDYMQRTGEISEQLAQRATL